jgi:excisionase family DNA binding protein
VVLIKRPLFLPAFVEFIHLLTLLAAFILKPASPGFFFSLLQKNAIAVSMLIFQPRTQYHGTKSMEAAKHIHYWPGTSQLTKSAKEVAKILSVHPNTLFRWVKAGKIECVRYSRNSLYFTYDQVESYINKNRELVKINV